MAQIIRQQKSICKQIYFNTNNFQECILQHSGTLTDSRCSNFNIISYMKMEHSMKKVTWLRNIFHYFSYILSDLTALPNNVETK